MSEARLAPRHGDDVGIVAVARMAQHVVKARSERPVVSYGSDAELAGRLERHDAYIHSLQWSRRFMGLKLFMSLATGYLRARLVAEGWCIRNDSRLPLLCFAPTGEPGDARILQIEQAVAASGRAWISSVRLRSSLVLRACITSFESTRRDIDALIRLLAGARAAMPQA